MLAPGRPLAHRLLAGAVASMVVVGIALAVAGPGAPASAHLAPADAIEPDGPTAVAPAPHAPPAWLAAYVAAAAACPGLDPVLLVAIHDVETGRDGAGRESTAGAVGPMQFLPSTWARYGVDANGNGVATPYELDDALAGATALLCANGAADPDTAGSAIWNYNHSWTYVAAVASRAAQLHALLAA